MGTGGPPGITYVAARWGAPTETFVRREASAVAALGVPVRARSMGRPRPADEAGHLDVDHLSRPRAAWSALVSVVRHPVRVARLLATLIRRSSVRNLRRQLWAVGVGLAWASALDDRRSHLHVHFGWVAATATWACTRITGQPYSVVLHAFELHAAQYVDAFAPVPLRSAAATFAISAFDARLVHDRFGVQAQVLRMGVTDDWLDAPAVRTPVPGSVVAVGTLVPQKGHEVLVRAVAAARERWDLTIVGEGPLRSDLEALVQELGLEDRVHLAGWLDGPEVRDRYDGAWVACLACTVASDGERDGIPVALMEAMARGVPVVTSRLGGIPELVDGVGVLVAPEDVGALADALEPLADPDERGRLGDLGRRRVREGFTAAAGAEQVAALICSSGPGRGRARETSRAGGSAAP